MPAPAVTATATELYDGLGPWAEADGDPTGWALLRLCDAAVGAGMLDDVVGWSADTTLGPGWSQVLDVDQAPTIFLPWLAQFVGVRLLGTMADADMRAAIRAHSSWGRGTLASIMAAAKQYLKAPQAIEVHERDTGPYHATVVVYAAEINASTYAELQSQYPTIAAFEAAYGFYSALPSSGLVPAAVAAVKPAGIVLDVQIAAGASYARVQHDYPTIAAEQAAFPTYAAALAYAPGTDWTTVGPYVPSSGLTAVGPPLGPGPQLATSPWAGFNLAAKIDGVNRGTASQGFSAGVSNSGVPGVSGVGAAAAFTLEAKIRPTTVGVVQSVAGRFTGGSPGAAQPFIFVNSDNTLWVMFRDNTGTILAASTAAAVIAANVSHDVAAVYDGVNVRLFIDGAAQTLAGGGTTLAVSGVEAPDTVTRFLIGRDDDVNQASNGGYPFAGLIDEVRWSNIARYPAAGYVPATVPFTPDANTLGLWHLDTLS